MLPPNNNLNLQAIDQAVDYLRDNSEAGAKARAERIYLEEYRKSLKAILMKKFTDLPVSAQEREAYAHPEYQNILKGLKQAVYNDEYHRYMRQSAVAKIDAWRTKEATNRSLDKIG
tara:strand:- start:92 stop:439 length:348 start_codon:yes stop_codon:yes gene_type:complete